MRGEHELAVFDNEVDAGSSPHARGAPHSTLGSSPPARIIPACAGSTRVEARSFFNWGDHPRMRGEHGKHGD